MAAAAAAVIPPAAGTSASPSRPQPLEARGLTGPSVRSSAPKLIILDPGLASSPAGRRLGAVDRPRAVPVRRPPTAAAALSVRPASAGDIPWISAWASELQLPVPTARRVMAYILLEGELRVGHIAGRVDPLVIDRQRVPVMWVISAFLIPSARGRGLFMRFVEILSRDLYPRGKVGARVAASNARMHKLMSVGGWTVRRSTRNYVDYLIDLEKPFKASR